MKKPIKQLRTVKYWCGEEAEVERIEDRIASLPKGLALNDLFKRIIAFYLDMSPEERKRFETPLHHGRGADD